LQLGDVVAHVIGQLPDRIILVNSGISRLEPAARAPYRRLLLGAERSIRLSSKRETRRGLAHPRQQDTSLTGEHRGVGS
jgi:hypothetical protein